MARKFIVVCDVCESDRDVSVWEVRHEGEKKKVELCATHSKPLADLLHEPEGAASPPSSPRRGGRRPRVQVTTPEEIEAQKTAQR